MNSNIDMIRRDYEAVHQCEALAAMVAVRNHQNQHLAKENKKLKEDLERVEDLEQLKEVYNARYEALKDSIKVILETLSEGED